MATIVSVTVYPMSGYKVVVKREDENGEMQEDLIELNETFAFHVFPDKEVTITVQRSETK